jgi:hypothetical protein
VDVAGTQVAKIAVFLQIGVLSREGLQAYQRQHSTTGLARRYRVGYIFGSAGRETRHLEGSIHRCGGICAPRRDMRCRSRRSFKIQRSAESIGGCQGGVIRWGKVPIGHQGEMRMGHSVWGEGIHGAGRIFRIFLQERVGSGRGKIWWKREVVVVVVVA